MSLIYARLALRRLAARLTLLVVATLLIGSPTSAPAGAATGNRPVYLPIIYVAGDAKIDVNTELIANTIVAPGDRIWVKFNVHNSGNAVTATKTAINLPFDKNELDYYTESRSSVNREEEYGEQFFQEAVLFNAKLNNILHKNDCSTDKQHHSSS